MGFPGPRTIDPHSRLQNPRKQKTQKGLAVQKADKLLSKELRGVGEKKRDRSGYGTMGRKGAFIMYVHKTF